MALTECVECGGKVSTRAEVCIHCGSPVEPPIPQINCPDCGEDFAGSLTACPVCGGPAVVPEGSEELLEPPAEPDEPTVTEAEPLEVEPISSKHEPYEDYYPDGQLREKGFKLDGEWDGPYEYYYANGNLGQKGIYESGKRCGEWVENGNPKIYPPCSTRTTAFDKAKPENIKSFNEALDRYLSRYSRSGWTRKVRSEAEALLSAMSAQEAFDEMLRRGYDLRGDGSGISRPSLRQPSQQHSTAKGKVDTSYAGFWIRVFAALIDTAVMFVLALLALQVLNEFGSLVVADFLGTVAYFVFMESSSKQATLGKMALGLKVTDLDGERIDFGRACLRYFGKIISYIVLLIGFLMVGFTEKKQGLHDMIAGTLVVRN